MSTSWRVPESSGVSQPSLPSNLRVSTIEHTAWISFLMLRGFNESGLKLCPPGSLTQPSLTNHENRKRHPCLKTIIHNRSSCRLIVRNVATQCSSELA